VVGTAADGRDAVQQVLKLRPDVVVMDIAMPQLNGIDAAGKIHETLPSLAIVMLSMHSSGEYVQRALQAGAGGYVLKQSAGVEVVDAIRAVRQGTRYFSKQIAGSAAEDLRRWGPSGSPAVAADTGASAKSCN